MKKHSLKIVSALLLTFFISSLPLFAYASDQAQNNKQLEIDELIKTAERHFVKGQEAYTNGQYELARREFDQAVDSILIGSIDIRSDDQLRIYYRQLIEKVNRYQIASLEQKDGGFSEQRYEPSPLDKIATLSEAELDEVVAEDNEPKNAVPKYVNDTHLPYSVRQFISYFTKGKGRVTMEVGLNRSVRYREMATRIFKEEGVPTDFIWLAQVESSWNPYAVSYAGAKGIWQFMPGTGADFGLTQTYWLDERSNPEKSTRAAAKYLKYLSNYFRGNWTLALAAYNTGPGNVDSAINRAGTRDFWALHGAGYLARETRNYVPAIIAVVNIAKNPERYGFQLPPSYTPKYETRTIAQQTDLRPLAKKLNVSYSSLVDLNPELQRGSTPPGKHLLRIPAVIVVPKDKIDSVEKSEEKSVNSAQNN
ncbi:MAG: lytic transglycosylase domain-containing protein [Acidobacteriota bacterium]